MSQSAGCQHHEKEDSCVDIHTERHTLEQTHRPIRESMLSVSTENTEETGKNEVIFFIYL